MSMPISEDPYYSTPAASWIRNILSEITDFQVQVDDTLGNRPIEIDSADQVIRVRPGLDMVRFHSVVGRAGLYIVGGPSWAPWFRTEPRLRLIEGEG